MKSGQVSQTALKVAASMITLNQKKGWEERLPEGLAALTERLILAADVSPYNQATLRLAKRRWAVRMSELGEMLQPGTFDGLGERKLFMNEQVLAAIQAGASQVLVVGAGFDTLCLRLAPQFPLLRFVEVDHPATAAAKRKAVEAEGRPGNMTMIAVDLGETALSAVLADCEAWDPDAQSVVVAEGLLLYLSADAVLALFREVDACTGAHSRVAFSHLLDLHRHGLARAVLRLYREPWLSSSRRQDLPAYVGSPWSLVATGAGRPRRDLEGFAVVQKSAN
jgi:methyltransferase (TIGR00027 family)